MSNNPVPRMGLYNGLLNNTGSYDAAHPFSQTNAGLEYGGVDYGQNEWNQQYQNAISTGNARNAPTTTYSPFTQGQQALGQSNLGNQAALAQSLNGIATGATPSLATQQAQQNLQQNYAAQTALANSARGGSALQAAAGREALQQHGMESAQMSAPLAALKAQGQLQAQGQLAGLYGTMGQEQLGAAQQGIGQAQYGANLAMTQEQLNQANQLAQQGFQQNVNTQQLAANTGIANQQTTQNAAFDRQVQQQNAALTNGLITGTATALGAVAGGPAGASAGYAAGQAGANAINPNPSSDARGKTDVEDEGLGAMFSRHMGHYR